MTGAAEADWSLAVEAAALLAVDPFGLGGATVRASAGPLREAWLTGFRALLPPQAPWRKIPPSVATSRLVGGVDLAATLGTGRPVAERGLLAEADGGVAVVPMAERIAASVVGPLAVALDTGLVAVERDGVSASSASRFAVLLLDEGLEDESAPAALCERVAFVMNLGSGRPLSFGQRDAATISAARARLDGVTLADDMLEAICATAMAFGVASLRTTIFAARAAKAAAALAGRDRVSADDIELALALTVAPRATMMPSAEAQDPGPPADPAQEPSPSNEASADRSDDDATDSNPEADLSEQLIEATRAAVPADLLASLSDEARSTPRQRTGGRAGAPQGSLRRGRPAGVRPGLPGQGGRLAIVETLRAAAPWQAIRRRERTAAAPSRVLVRREDLRVAKFTERSETTIIFVVDASGSAAFNRLAEVKGAVELILADCYVRRDSVALFAFRGTQAELILPPTRSLPRAKRALAGQPGGGGTPLATAIDAAVLLAEGLRRKGIAPLIVFLTDGHANVSRSGQAGRAAAEADALDAARALRAASLAALFIDVAPRPQERARKLATMMGAQYRPLPLVEATALSQAILTSSQAQPSSRRVS